MKLTHPFALKLKNVFSHPGESFEYPLIFLTVAFTGIFTIIDIFSDIDEGASAVHLTLEGLITLLSFICVGVLLRRSFSLFQEMQFQKFRSEQAEIAKHQAMSEADHWRNEAAVALKGLSDAIDTQLTRWQLSPAEKEVALLLLKGLSLKEIAEVRSVTEKTARAQSFAVYAKSGLSGRAELSAFFLEDLLVPIRKIPNLTTPTNSESNSFH